MSTKSDPKPGHFALDQQYWHLSTQLEALLRGFPQVLLLLDEEGKILDYQTGDPSLLFMPPDQFLQKNIRDVFPPDTGSQVIRAVENARSTDQVAAFRCQLPTLGGTRWFDLRAVYTSDRHIVLAGRDAGEQVSAVEATRRQLQQVSALHAIDSAAIASFDLKVTLSVILREILNQLSVDAADILLLDPQSNMLEFAAGLGFRNPEIPHAPIRLGQGYAGSAARERRTVSSSRLDHVNLGNVSAAQILHEHFVSYYAVPLLAKGQIKGVLEIYCRAPLPPTENWLEFLNDLASHAALAIDSAKQFQELQKKVLELSVSSDLAIEAWIRALEISGRENREHIRRVADLTVEVARKLQVGEAEIVNMRRGALLHDVGFLGIPETILLKAGSLTPEERAIVQEHPDLALHLLQPLPHLTAALDIPRYHHERWDGSGYPEGLKGEQISLAARIFAVVDVFDALTSTRPYRPARSRKEALEYIRQQAGVKFDPHVVEAFLAVVEGASHLWSE